MGGTFHGRGGALEGLTLVLKLSCLGGATQRSHDTTAAPLLILIFFKGSEVTNAVVAQRNNQ